MNRDVEVGEDDAGARLDRWMARMRPDLSYGLIQKLLRKGQIRVNGKRAKPDTKLAAGQVVRMPLGGGDEDHNGDRPFVQDHLRPSVIYADEDILVFDKPAGLAVQGGSGLKIHLEMLMEDYAVAGVPPRLVHRLDRETSGVLVMARSAKIARELGAMFSGRDTQKTYLALVSPAPKDASGMIDAPLDKVNAGTNIEKMQVQADGRPAQTAYRRVQKNASGDAALVEFKPLTGRTHQIRVHAAYAGFPLVGDEKYGGDMRPWGKKKPRVALHAAALSLAHPGTGEEIEFSAPLPDDLRAALAAYNIEDPT